MNIKNMVIKTAMCVAPLFAGGCTRLSQTHIVDAKQNYTITIHSTALPHIQRTIVFPQHGDEMDFYNYINVGDTLETRRLDKRSAIVNSCSHSYRTGNGAIEKSIIKTVNGKTLEQLHAMHRAKTR